MKKIISTCIALMVSAACSISAFAMEVPTNTTIQDLNGVRQYIKIYTVAPDTDPQSLIDDVFEYDGYTYTYSSMTKEEQSYSEKEHHTETVTADTEKSDLSVVLKALSPSIEYDDGEFRGTLYLDHSTISTVASGYTTKSYTVSTTKEIDNLDTNDMAYVPDTTTKNGVTVQLQSVDWQVQGTSLVDDILVPAQYKAVATYAGRASYRAATGYVTTAKYIGDIVAEGIESVTYMLELTKAQPGFYSKDGLHEPFLLRFTGNGKGAGYLFSVAWLDAATHIATVPRMKGERIIWISESGSFGEIDLPRHHFFAARQKDGTHRFFGSNEPEKI